MFSHAIPCQGGETRAVGRGRERGCLWKGGCRDREKEREREDLVCHGGCEHVGDEGGGMESLRRRVLSGLDACKINILWTLLLD